MAGGSNGYRAALVRRQLTPGLISSLPGTVGLPPFISFSTTYPELDSAVRRPMPRIATAGGVFRPSALQWRSISRARASRSPGERAASGPTSYIAGASALATYSAQTSVSGRSRSPLPVVRENVISRFHDRVARQSALGVVRLRRLVSRAGGCERIGRSVVLEGAPSPSAAVREPLAVLHHEVDVMQACRHRRSGERLELFRIPMNLRHLGAVGERLAVSGNAGLVGLDHHGIGKDHSHHLFVVTDGDGLPAFVSSELREREPIRYFHGVLVLRRAGHAAGDSERYRNDHNRRDTFALHLHPPRRSSVRRGHAFSSMVSQV